MVVASTDTFKVKYTASGNGGVFDGEEREIPVLPVGTVETEGRFYHVITSYSIHYTKLYEFIHAVQNPEMVVANPVSWSYFGRMGDYVTGSSLGALLWGNLTNGKLAVFHSYNFV